MGMGRPAGSTNDRTWRGALVKAVNRRTEGKGSPKKLELIANKCVDQAVNGEGWAVKEVGDRLDGKPAQAVDMAVAVQFTAIEYKIVDPLAIEVEAVEVLPSNALRAAVAAISAPDGDDPS